MSILMSKVSARRGFQRTYLRACAVLIALAAAAPAWAVQPDEMLSNPVLEARARAISKDLRCMVCQNAPAIAGSSSVADNPGDSRVAE